ncbi:MAG: hypothetical protein OEV44_13275 [Spirochaetota bacterium]|nr:hypothetical protein [Spirochaetota bacterium]
MKVKISLLVFATTLFLFVNCGPKAGEKTPEALKQKLSEREKELETIKEKKEIEAKLKEVNEKIAVEKGDKPSEYVQKVQEAIKDYKRARSNLSKLVKKYDKGKYKDKWQDFETEWNKHVKVRQDIIAKLDSLKSKAKGDEIKYHDKFVELVGMGIKAMSDVSSVEKLSESRKNLKKESAVISKLFKEVEAFHSPKKEKPKTK